MPSNYFNAESKIIAKLKADIPAFKDVIGVGGILQDDPSAYCPLAQVSHDGFSLGDYKRGMQSQLTQRWLIAIIAESPNDKDGAFARAEAGPLMISVIKSLTGWSPDVGYSPMVPSNSKGDFYTEDNIAVFTMVFTTNVVI